MNDERRPARNAAATSSALDGDGSDARGRSAPAVLIEFPFEGHPRITAVWDTDADDWRMSHWFDANPEYAELVHRAVELAEAAA